MYFIICIPIPPTLQTLQNDEPPPPGILGQEPDGVAHGHVRPRPPPRPDEPRAAGVDPSFFLTPGRTSGLFPAEGTLPFSGGFQPASYQETVPTFSLAPIKLSNFPVLGLHVHTWENDECPEDPAVNKDRRILWPHSHFSPSFLPRCPPSQAPDVGVERGVLSLTRLQIQSRPGPIAPSYSVPIVVFFCTTIFEIPDLYWWLHYFEFGRLF